MFASARALLAAPLVPDHEPRPRLENHGSYIFGIFIVAVAVPDENVVYYQEIDVVVTPEQLLTVTKSPPDEHSFDTSVPKAACHPDEPVGMYLFRLVDDLAERWLDLFDDMNDGINMIYEKAGTLCWPQM